RTVRVTAGTNDFEHITTNQVFVDEAARIANLYLTGGGISNFFAVPLTFYPPTISPAPVVNVTNANSLTVTDPFGVPGVAPVNDYDINGDYVSVVRPSILGSLLNRDQINFSNIKTLNLKTGGTQTNVVNVDAIPGINANVYTRALQENDVYITPDSKNTEN